MGVVRNQSIKNSISYYIGMGLGALNTIIIYPRVFEDNPEQLGLIQILIAYGLVIATFTTLGTPKTFVRFFPSIKEKGQLYFLSFIMPIIGFLLAALFYFLFKEEIFSFLNASKLLRDNFYYIILLVFFIGFYDVLTAISRSFLSASLPVFINEVFLKVYNLFILTLYWYGCFEFSSFIKIYLFGYVLKFVILFFIQFIHKRFELTISFKDLKLREMLKFGVYVLVGGASIMLVSRLDMMMIGALLDLEQVAFYTIAFFIGNAIKLPSNSIGAIATPLVAKAWEKQDVKEIKKLYSKSSINQLIIGGVFFLCVWLNIDEIFSLLPDKYSHGKWVVLFIGLSQLFNITTGINGIIIINSKYYRYDLITNVLLVALTLVTNYLLIPIYGINGAALATAISVLIFNLTKLIIVKVKMKMHPFSSKTIYALLLLIVLYFGISSLSVTDNIFINIIWRSTLALVLYIPIIYLLELSKDINKVMLDIYTRIIHG